MRRPLPRFALFAFVSWIGATCALGAELAERIGEVTSALEYKHAHWGLLIVDRATGEVIHELNADKLFMPASTTKLYSVATALDALGAEYRFRTPIYRRGELAEDGRLAGDLILVASGDLTLGGRTDAEGRIAFKDNDHTYASFNGKAELTEPDPLGGIRELARQVLASGVRRVEGDVVIDDRLFDQTESTGSGPGTVTPILINDNVLDIWVVPGALGGPAGIDWRPRSAACQVDAYVETVDVGAESNVSLTTAGPNRFVVRGRIAAERKPVVLSVEVADPASFARAVLIEALASEGIVVSASPLGDNPRDKLPAPELANSGLVQVAELVSPPFAENARLILKVSHNLHASTLPLLVAAKNGKRTLDEGLRLQHDFLVRGGVEADTISFGGGAGGSRGDYTTPRATVQLLRAMAERPDFAVYREALPILGVDGTTATAVGEESPARGKIQAKTGTYLWYNAMNDRYILSSKALAGYLQAASGRELAFAFFVNHAHIQKSTDSQNAGKTLGRLCEIVHEAL